MDFCQERIAMRARGAVFPKGEGTNLKVGQSG